MGVQNPNQRPKIRVKPIQPPKRPEVSVQAPKVKVRRGQAPNVFTESPIRNPIERIQTQQARHTARAVQNAVHAERGNADKGAMPAAPNRPLTNREAAKVLSSPQARTVAATLPKIKVKPKGGGFNLTPAAVVHLPGAVLSDIPKELTGKGAVEGAVTAIGNASAKGWAMVPGVGHELGNVVKDTSGVISGAVPSVYIPASQALTGHPGKAASTIYGGIKQTVTHPLEHPVSLLMIARGGEGAISRGAGELARHAPIDAVREYASTERTPISLGGTALETRKASKGLIENRVQKALDSRQAKKQGTTVVKVPVRSGSGDLRYTAKVRALKPTDRQLNAPHIMGGKLNRRVDTEAGKHNVRVRNVRDAATHTMATVKPTTHEDAVALVNEGIIKRGNTHRPLTSETVRQDLQNHLDQLAAARPALKEPSDLAANAEQTAQVERLLRDQKFLANPKLHLKAARTYAESLRTTEPARVKYGDLTQAQINRRPLLPFAVREMGLRYDEASKRFIDPVSGRPVSNQTITDAFVRKGGDPKDLAYVPALDRSGTSNFYGSGIRRPGAERKSYTGSSALAGAYPRTFDALHQHLVGSAVRVARHESVNNIVNTFGLKQASGKYFDTTGAKKEIANMKAATGEDYVAVTAARQKVPEGLMGELTPEQMQQTFHQAEPGDSHVVLFPKTVWERLQQHEQGRGRNPAQQDIQRVSQAFRHTVLLTSSKWIAGNSLEGYLRMQINEMTPAGVARTIQAGRKYENDVKALGTLGEQKVAELQGAAGAGIFRSQKQLDLAQPDNALAKFAHAFRTAGLGKGKITKQIGPNGIANLWDHYANAVTKFNGVGEQGVYYYALGKSVRDEVKGVTTAWERALRKAGPAYADVVSGALDSNKIAEYARAVDFVRGRYTNLSPRGRYWVTTYTPFAPWYVNSLHFFAVTLPGHHPVKTGLLAAAAQGTTAQRKKLDLPPWAQGIPLGKGKVLPLQNYLPTGITTSGLGGAAGLVNPQASGLLGNLKGQSWTGQKLPPGTEGKVALNTALGSFIPFYSKVQTVLERGGKAQADSTLFHPKVKAGTKRSIGAGIAKAVNPMRPQKTTAATVGGPAVGVSSGPSAADILGNSAGPSVSDILGSTP